MTDRDFLRRYRRGEHAPVWRDLRALGALEGDLRAEAQAVAAETMIRVARCADLLAERLAARGWRALFGRLRHMPDAGDVAFMAEIEQRTGNPLPPSLRAFWEIVGGINFVWDYRGGEPPPKLGPDLDMGEMDPLCVDPCRHAADFERWDDFRANAGFAAHEAFDVYLAPDRLHKANTSGGPPYAIDLPFAGTDPIFAREEHRLPFTDYLRFAFRWAGFPGLEAHADDAEVQRFLAEMTRDLEPF